MFSHIPDDYEGDEVDYVFLKMDGDEIYPVFVENTWEAHDEEDNPLPFMSVVWRIVGYDDDNTFFDLVKFDRIFLN